MYTSKPKTVIPDHERTYYLNMAYFNIDNYTKIWQSEEVTSHLAIDRSVSFIACIEKIKAKYIAKFEIDG